MKAFFSLHFWNMMLRCVLIRSIILHHEVTDWQHLETWVCAASCCSKTVYGVRKWVLKGRNHSSWWSNCWVTGIDQKPNQAPQIYYGHSVLGGSRNLTYCCVDKQVCHKALCTLQKMSILTNSEVHKYEKICPWPEITFFHFGAV